MSNPAIAQAIIFAQHAAHCHRTGQPNLAALYEKNCLLQMRKALIETRRKRIEANPFRAVMYMAEDMTETFSTLAAEISRVAGVVADVLKSMRDQQDKQSDFALLS